jgi:CBS domain-containing protein
MRVIQAMTRDVQLASPDDTLHDVAAKMAKADIGFLPVGENDRLVGTITDRDMVVRALADGRDGATHVRDVMTKGVKYCFEDEDIDHVIANMGENKVRRMPVVNRAKRLVGVLSLADVALGYEPEAVGESLAGVVEPGGAHSQSA